MKNHQKIRKLSVKELAKILVYPIEINEGDEGSDGEWQDYFVKYYRCPNGIEACDKEGAIQETMDWLNCEYKKE